MVVVQESIGAGTGWDTFTVLAISVRVSQPVPAPMD
jgi:hypothetical protein